jgi:hypothetical protein
MELAWLAKVIFIEDILLCFNELQDKLCIVADIHNIMFDGNCKQFIYLDKVMLRFISMYKCVM